MTSTSVGSIHYDLGLNTDKFDRESHNVSGKLAGIGSSLKSMATGFAIAGGAAATAFGVSAYKAFTQANEIMGQTDAVLKSTGGAAKVTKEEILSMARSFQGSTKFADEVVQSGENLLLTFTSIGREVFPEATETMLDMSQALGQDVKSSAIQLGKALNSPIDGVTALRRVGVQFNDQQEETIKKLVESGDLLGAQKMILKELKTEFGGSAKAASDAAGPLEKLKDRYQDFQETVGQLMRKGLDKILEKLPAIAEKMREAGTKIGDYLMPKLRMLWRTIEEQVLPTLTRLWREVIEPLIPVIGTVLVGAIGLAIDIFSAFLDVIMPVANWMLDHKDTVLGLAAAFGALALAMKFDTIVTAFSNSMSAITTAISGVSTNMSSFISYVGGPLPAAAFAGLAAAAIAAFVLIMNWIDRVKAQFDQLMGQSIDYTRQMEEVNRQWKQGQISTEQYKQKISELSGKIGQANKDAVGLERQLNSGSLAQVIDVLKGKTSLGSFLYNKLQGRASGGPVSAGQPYVVGEKRPELFVPKQSGYVVPQVPQGGVTINIGTIHDRADMDYLLRRLDRSQELMRLGVSPS